MQLFLTVPGLNCSKIAVVCEGYIPRALWDSRKNGLNSISDEDYGSLRNSGLFELQEPTAMIHVVVKVPQVEESLEYKRFEPFGYIDTFSVPYESWDVGH